MWYEECIYLTKWHQNIFSVTLKFGTYYITSQCSEFIKKCYLILLYFFWISFIACHYQICNFIIFISFFDKIWNFRNSILANQKREIVVSNCHRSCMWRLSKCCGHKPWNYDNKIIECHNGYEQHKTLKAKRKKELLCAGWHPSRRWNPSRRWHPSRR